MALTLDLAAANRPVSDSELRTWAAGHSVFLSSVMGELAAERKAVVAVLEDVGLNVRWFEGFGGRDDSAETAYINEVASSDIYLGLLADRYGVMLPSHRSPTHEEYREARARGKHVSFWAKRDASDRQGNAVDFLQEVQTFNVTGNYDTVEDLPGRVLKRLRELAGQDIAVWLKLGELVLRADSINSSGQSVELVASVRDRTVLNALQKLDRSGQPFGSGPTLQLTLPERSGQARVTGVAVGSTSTLISTVTVTLAVDWASGSQGLLGGMSLQGVSSEEVTEVGLRAGLFGDSLPPALVGGVRGMVTTSDPLAPLKGTALGEGSLEPVARLLLVEHLVGQGLASGVDDVRLGPAHRGQRRLSVTWTELQRYTNQAPDKRSIEGDVAWHQPGSLLADR